MFDSNSPFENKEKVGRSIPLGFWDKNEDRPSSSLFRNQINGCSVDRQGNRDEQELINALLKSHKESMGVAVLQCKNIWDAECIIIASPNEDNCYHCSIQESIEKSNDISKSKARKLAKACVSTLR